MSGGANYINKLLESLLKVYIHSSRVCFMYRFMVIIEELDVATISKIPLRSRYAF